MCIAEGVPDIPFFVDTDLTRADGIIQCRQLTDLETVKLAWKFLRVLKYLPDLPIAYE